MMRFVLIMAVCLFFVTGVTAQANLTGRIFENKTKIFLQGVKVENLRSHLFVVADNNGNFSIKAAIGDRVMFTGFGYQSDTLYVADLKYTEIYLEPKVNMLQSVTVVTQQVRTGSMLAPTTGPLGGRTLLYQADAEGNPIGGVKMMLFDSHSGEKKKAKERQQEADWKTESEINQVFSNKNLQNYLPIKGQEMDNFIILYTPNARTYQDKGFNLALYLDACYKEFLKIPLEKRQAKDYLDLKRGN